MWIKPDAIRFINSFYKFTDMDTLCFIRSNYDTAHNIVQGFESDEAIANLKEEIPNFKNIRV